MSYSTKEFQIDMSMLNTQATESVSDLQLAAELGKLLLERNEELESVLRVCHEKIDDQEEQIRNLSKQTRALHEVNDSRLKIYEQLEINIEELERTNHRLAIQNSSEREQSWHLKDNICKLENKCSDLQETIEALNKQLVICRQRSIVIEKEVEQKYANETFTVSYTDSTPKVIDAELIEQTNLTQEISILVADLETSQQQLTIDRSKILKLEEELAQMVQKNKDLEDQIVSINEQDSFKSVDLQDLDGICTNGSTPEGMSLFDEIEEDDSLLEAIGYNSECASFYGGLNDMALTSTPPKPKANLYKELIDKYEALLELHNNRHEELVKTPDSGVKVGSPTSFSEISTGSTDCSCIEIGTQTEEYANLQIGQHELVLYDPSNKIRKVCNHPKYKQLFLALLKEIEKDAGEKIDKGSSTTKSAIEATTDYNRNASSIAKPELVTEQITINVDKIEELNEKIKIKIEADIIKLSENIQTKKNEPELVPYIRKPIEEIYVQSKKVLKRKSKSNENTQTPILVGCSNIKYLNKSADLDIKTSTNLINFHYPEYKKSSARKYLNKLQDLDSTYTAVLKKSNNRFVSTNN